MQHEPGHPASRFPSDAVVEWVHNRRHHVGGLLLEEGWLAECWWEMYRVDVHELTPCFGERLGCEGFVGLRVQDRLVASMGERVIIL